MCLFYRPPSSSVSIFDDLCTTLHIVNPAQFSNFLLIGDFNVNFCNQEHYLFSYVSDILYIVFLYVKLCHRILTLVQLVLNHL